MWMMVTVLLLLLLLLLLMMHRTGFTGLLPRTTATGCRGPSSSGLWLDVIINMTGRTATWSTLSLHSRR
uniref:Putative secreted peptide n=1 Tax=Anopheles braziliensis TaxID=58242 RepID=A0A2M3ZXR5_9DIPT